MRCVWRFLDVFKKLFARGGVVIFRRGIRQIHQSSLGKEWHGIDRVVQIVFVHRTCVEASGVHVRAGGIREAGLKFLELARDGEFVVAEEEVDVGHEFLTTKRHNTCTARMAPPGSAGEVTMEKAIVLCSLLCVLRV